MSILLLSGSPSIPSRSSRLLHHIGERLNARGQATVSIHVRDLPAQALLHADFGDPELQAAQQLLIKYPSMSHQRILLFRQMLEHLALLMGLLF